MSAEADRELIRRAVALAAEAEAAGNLPIGALLVLDGRVVAEGRNAVLRPVYDPGRHAEIEAARGLPKALWAEAERLTCYSTLEPCLMCTSTLLLHGVRRIVFGAADVEGGGRYLTPHLPPYYRGRDVAWVGPLLPEVCDPLYRRARARFSQLPCGR